MDHLVFVFEVVKIYPVSFHLFLSSSNLKLGGVQFNLGVPFELVELYFKDIVLLL